VSAEESFQHHDRDERIIASSAKIAAIVSAIDQIAFQTNLLG